MRHHALGDDLPSLHDRFRRDRFCHLQLHPDPVRTKGPNSLQKQRVDETDVAMILFAEFLIIEVEDVFASKNALEGLVYPALFVIVVDRQGHHLADHCIFSPVRRSYSTLSCAMILTFCSWFMTSKVFDPKWIAQESRTVSHL